MADIYRKVYRNDVQAVGADAAYLLAEIKAYADFCKNNDQIDNDGYFELSAPKVEEMTGYERHKQRRVFDKLTESGIIEKKIVNNSRYIRLTGARICTTKCADLYHQVRENVPPSARKCTTSLYNDKSFDKNVNSCSQEQQNIFDLVDAYFHELGFPNETREFMKYNRREYGEEHITPDNYKKFVKRWIKRKGNPPKKKASSGRGGKTAAEVAESQGVTVTELMGGEETDKPAETGPADDDFINDIFGG